MHIRGSGLAVVGHNKLHNPWNVLMGFQAGCYIRLRFLPGEAAGLTDGPQSKEGGK
ncbi:hypothetical protein GCM10007061_24970 [Kocuria marina]|nr:hypothetical protein GCM10007061_24970 [Kocuria marina]